MSFFGLSQQGTQEQLDFADSHPVLESDIKPGFFQGAFDQPFSGVESAWAKHKYATAVQSPSPYDPEGYKSGLLDQVEKLRPDPKTIGLAGQLMHGINEMMAGGLLEATSGNITPQTAAMSFGRSTEIVQKPLNMRLGMDEQTAEDVAKVQGAGAGLSLILPASAAGSFATRAATGGAINLFSGAGERALIANQLEKNGRPDLASQYHPFDAAESSVDFIVGALTGGLLGERPGKPDVLPSHLDPALVINNAGHVQVDTMPGVPKSAEAFTAHAKQMNDSIDALLNDEPVPPVPNGHMDHFDALPETDFSKTIEETVAEHMGPEWVAAQKDLGDRGLPTDLELYSFEPNQSGPVRFTDNVKSMLSEWDQTKDTEALIGRLKALEGKLEVRAADNADKRLASRERGELWIRERLIRAERHGEISPEAHNIAKWLLDKNPNVANDLAISLKSKGGGSEAGSYNPINRVVTLIKGAGSDTTVGHEILHHTERMMPEDVRDGIRDAWIKSLDRLQRQATEAQDHRLMMAIDDALKSAVGDREAFNRITDQIQSGALPYDFYQYVNPSEFWAVNGADLIKNRSLATGWVGNAKQWLKEFIEKIKEAFGLDNNAAVIRGLNSVMEGDGSLFGKMLSDGSVYNRGKGISESVPYAKDERVRPASPEDIKQANEFEKENGIRPYYSDGQLEVPVELQTQYSIKQPYNEKEQAKGARNHPLLNLPLNKNGTVTLYFPTTNENARRTVLEKKLRADNPQANRIYLTNESSAGKVAETKGNIEQEVGGANVLVHIDPNLLQLDHEFEDGRKDFYIQLAEGESFIKKMRQTKLFTLNKSRKDAISEDVTFKNIGDGIKQAVDELAGMDRKSRQAAVREAKKILKQEHNVSTLLSENGKLQKTRVGDYGLDYEGNSVASMGLGLASAQALNRKKLTTCLKSAICEALCLGETSGQNLLYGGEGAFRSGPRLSQYLKTEAMVLHPKEFGILLSHEISLFKAWAQRESGIEKVKDETTGDKVALPKQVYQAAIRLNVTSDFPPSVFEALINAHPDVQFYDYTKLSTDKIAENHHLTYSSTGASQEVNGKTIFNPHSNWNRMVKKMNEGFNVAMAFSNRDVLPKFVIDEASGQKFKVWDGDQYDARFLDPKQEDGIGMIIGLTNKDRTTMPGLSAEKHNGFFVHYDPAVDGDTVTIKDQSKFKAALPEAKPTEASPTEQFTAAGIAKNKPDMTVVGDNGVVGNAAQMLEQADAEITRVKKESKSFEVAATCALS